MVLTHHAAQLAGVCVNCLITYIDTTTVAEGKS